MKYPYTYIDQAVRMLKALVASYIVTGLLLLLTAGLLYRFELSEGKVRIMIIVTYILSCFAGGFLSVNLNQRETIDKNRYIIATLLSSLYRNLIRYLKLVLTPLGTIKEFHPNALSISCIKRI